MQNKKFQIFSLCSELINREALIYEDIFGRKMGR